METNKNAGLVVKSTVMSELGLLAQQVALLVVIAAASSSVAFDPSR